MEVKYPESREDRDYETPQGTQNQETFESDIKISLKGRLGDKNNYLTEQGSAQIWGN